MLVLGQYTIPKFTSINKNKTSFSHLFHKGANKLLLRSLCTRLPGGEKIFEKQVSSKIRNERLESDLLKLTLFENKRPLC